MPNTADLFQPLENAIRVLFLRNLLRREISDLERDIISLSARFGGLSIFNPTIECKFSHDNSALVSLPLVRLIMRQEAKLDPLSLQEEVNRLMIWRRSDTKKDMKIFMQGPFLKCNGIYLGVASGKQRSFELQCFTGEFTDAISRKFLTSL